MLELDIIHLGDTFGTLMNMPSKSVHCIITSPPYFGLRNYDNPMQLGMEKTFEEYVAAMVQVFEEAKRVLRDDGTLWLNLGDSYSTGGRGFSSQMNQSDNTYSQDMGWRSTPGLKRKELIGIPWRVAFALQTAGWYLRQDIIWNKPNPMPESVTDRCTKAHEYIFLMSKKPKYYYDHTAIKMPIKDASIARLNQDIANQEGSERAVGKVNGKMKAVGGRKGGADSMGLNGSKLKGHKGYFDANGELIGDGFANKKSVWTVATKPFKEAHFATYPPELIRPCILAGCPVGGIVLDIFMGSGTTAIVALENDRHYIGIELNPEYRDIALRRIDETKKRIFRKKQQLKLEL